MRRLSLLRFEAWQWAFDDLSRQFASYYNELLECKFVGTRKSVKKMLLLHIM